MDKADEMWERVRHQTNMTRKERELDIAEREKLIANMKGAAEKYQSPLTERQEARILSEQNAIASMKLGLQNEEHGEELGLTTNPAFATLRPGKESLSMRKGLAVSGAKKSGRRVVKTSKGTALVISGAKKSGRRVKKTPKGTALVLTGGHIRITQQPARQPPKPRPYHSGKPGAKR